MSNTKSFEDWYEEYRDAFMEESNMEYSIAAMVIDRSEAKRSFDRGLSPEKAARKDAHFIETGEY